ncbi:DUF433 domain-containing protein [Spirulina major]|uniref:DUF433 domain-containing protein n=1 Tax=Spirulina major TaxID=270636 RepID=UPI000934CD4B|nr:DUF433 domain-containing protein [Spirulina major]
MPETPWLTNLNDTPTYRVADAAHYIRVPTVTLSTWLNGRTYTTQNGKRQSPPLIQRPNPKTPLLSFNNLLEGHILRVIRETHGIPLSNVRGAIDYLGQKFNTSHPLIHNQFKTDGVDLFMEHADLLINVSRAGQLAIRAVIQDLLKRIEWEDNIAVRLYPFISPTDPADKIISIDPRYSFGKPIITATGVPTDVLAEFYNAGDTIEDLAADYECTPAQVRAAIRFESSRQAA